MGESDRYHDYRSFQRSRRSIFFAQGNNPLFWLITLNVVTFLTLLFVRVGYGASDNTDALFYSEAFPKFTLPGTFQALMKKPWTFLIYSFADTGFLRLLSNMLWLWAFGSIMQGLTGSKKLFPVYLYGSWFAALLFITGYLLFPRAGLGDGVSLSGASYSVMAVATAATMLEPQYRLFSNINGGIPLWILYVAYFIIAILGVGVTGVGYVFALLGAAAVGFFYVWLLRRGTDSGVWMVTFYNWISNLFNPGRQKESVKEKVFYNAGSRAPYSKTANLTQQRIDDILDKINQDGYASLSEEERKILKRAAEEDL